MIILHSILPCFMYFFNLNGHGLIDSSSVKDTYRFDNFALRKSVETERFRTALLSSVVVAVPMALDIFLDFFLASDRQDERLRLYTRAITLIALAGPNLLLLSVDFRNATAEVYMYSFFFFRIASVTCGLVHLTEITSSLRNSRVIIYILAISLLFAVHCLANEVDPMYNFSYLNFLKLLSIASYLLIGVAMIFFGRELFISRNSSFLWKDLLSVELTVLSYAVSLAIMNIGFSRISHLYGASSTLNASSDCICMHTYIQMTFTVMVITMQSRITRIEAMKQSRFVKERQAFIRYISHEIRTPLNTVFLGLEFVTSELLNWNSPKLKSQVLPILETVNDIRSSCQISLSILDDLLTFDKMEGGKMTLELKYLNCCSFIAAVAKPFQVNARERGITFNFCRDLVLVNNSCSGCLHIDSSKMGQVMRNLISNALKFTPVGGTVTISVSYVSAPCDTIDNRETHPVDTSEVAAANSHRILRIEVIDSGAGISEMDQSRLFGQYVQFNANKLQKGSGSGLGLWISKGITELHGGSIGAFSKGEGYGSTFFLELPVFLDAADEGDGDSQSDIALSSVAKAFSNTRDEYLTEGSSVSLESSALPPHTIKSCDSSSSSAPTLTPSSHQTSFLTSNVTPAAYTPACSSSVSAICSSVDTRECRDGYLAYQALNDTDGFLSSADHFMVTSTPQSRGSGRATRSSRAMDRFESYGGLSRTSGQCTPATLSAFGEYSLTCLVPSCHLTSDL
jgi:signal transduction histidine kinase